MYQQKYFDMTEDQRQAAFDENNSYQVYTFSTQK